MTHKKLQLVVITLSSLLTLNSAQAQGKIIYGVDDRIDAFDSFITPIESKILAATAAMISNRNIRQYSDGSVTIFGEILGTNKKMCYTERFYTQKTSATCSGFLVGKDLLVTAGHCITSLDSCKDNKWVFNYRMRSADSLKRINRDDVYTCKYIVSRKLNRFTDQDYALVKLDRKVSWDKVTDLKYRKEGRIDRSSTVAIIGHPSGLPSKITRNGEIFANRSSNFFETNLDSYAGNSGSVVYNQNTGQVEGILVRGSQDYATTTETYEVTHSDGTTTQESRVCKGSNRVDNTPGYQAEDVTRITTIPELMYTSTDKSFITAIKLGNYQEAFELLKDDANPSTRDLETGENALHILLRNNADILVIREVLSFKPDVNQLDYRLNNPIHMMLDMDSLELIELLIELDVDLNARNSKGQTILMRSIITSNHSLTNLLLINGAGINYTDNLGNSAILLAALNNNIELTQRLIKKGANLWAKNSKKKTLLRAAVDVVNPEMLELFLKEGMRPRRGIIYWVFGGNDYSYAKKKYRKAKKRSSQEIVLKLKQMKDQIKAARGKRIFF